MKFERKNHWINRLSRVLLVIEFHGKVLLQNNQLNNLI